jgi:hypothetical protein
MDGFKSKCSRDPICKLRRQMFIEPQDHAAMTG